MKYSLTAIGLDRHGIVKDVTKILFDNDCNLEDSSMTILESNFAIILIMKPSKSSDISKIKKDIEELERTSGLKIQLKELEETEPTVEKGSHIVTVYGGDKSGIVYKTASLLAEKNVNITDLETKIIETEKNKDIYIMTLEVILPKDLTLEEARKEMDKLKEELSVDITINEIESYDEL